MTPKGKVDRNALPLSSDTAIEAPADSGMPRDMLEQQLAQLWRRILGVRQAGLRDNFFDLGGDSLTAARMFYEIERLTGKNLPVAILFRAPTLGQLADTLRNEGWSPHWSSLVPINAGGSQLPFFLVHGAEGNVLLYRKLALYLGPEQPVYGFQSQGLDGERNFHAKVEEMAAHYVRELTTLQPSGPYRLGGYCLGGTIAFEMAQQLQAQGERVGLLVMLDTYNSKMISASKLRTLPLFSWLQNVWFHGANLFSIENKERRSFVREKWNIALTRLGIRLRALGHAILPGPGGQKSYPHLRVKRVNDQAEMAYVPRPYSGRVVVIRPKKNFLGLDEPSLGWSGLIRGNLEVRKIPVYPKGMLVEPFVQTLGRELRACLREAK